MTKTLPLTVFALLTTALALVPLQPAGAGAAIEADLDAFIASLEGGWAGEENTTPFGRMPFALLFERQEDGSLHARSSLNRDTYIDLRFAKDEGGRWILSEEAAMEGSDGQRHSLVPGEGPGGMHRWIHEESPEYLAIDVGRHDDTMTMEVTLRGRPHVRFELDRLPADEVPALRQELLEAAQTSPEEGESIFDVVEFPPAAPTAAAADPAAADPIAEARQALAAAPDDATAYLSLARTLGEAINQNPANGPVYAGEMLTSLRRAIELDPRLAEAYHWLVGYYLNAPPIAGGSIDKAEQTALRLAEFDAAGAAPLLEEIESRRTVVEN